MQKIQLYIEGQRVDMFDDESVVITQTIKNLKDIGKIFTDFTRTFSLPATKINNKIFKHYYNYHIQDGFDARVRVAANIELNTLPFTDGRVKLEGVDLKDNKPHTYKITFFGSTVTLKDLVGDDSLSGLPFPTSLNETYDAASVKAALQINPTTNDIIVPLITHTQRLTYDSHSSANYAGNVAWDEGYVKGVLYSDLKYAIRLHKIIEVIESKYTITFSNDFFVSTNLPYYNLFMWLHRKKGKVENLSGLNESLIDGFTNGADANTNSLMFDNALELTLYSPSPFTYSDIRLNSTTTSTNPYRISIRKNGVEVANSGDITSGSQAITSVPLDDIEQNALYTAYIQSEFSLTFSDISFEVIKYDNTDPLNPITYTKNYTITNYSYTSSFEFDIAQQIPDIKVIDFLSGLFKMFNLTAFVDDITNEIVVKTLDSFYSGGSSYDITKYIDVSKSQVNIALPYREINFQHEDTETFLAAFHKQKFGKTWGKSEYTGSKKLDGGIYDIKTPFSQMKYERLIDENTGNHTSVQVGWFVDDNKESYVGKPLLFYPIRQLNQDSIAFLNSETSQEELDDYIIPSNSVALLSSTSSYNMNFFAEQNEYAFFNTTPDIGFTNTLFQAYYSNYIESVFNESNRITKVTAYLPLRILLNYTLADRFVMGGNSYKINSIKTNLKNGKSDIELLNDL